LKALVIITHHIMKVVTLIVIVVASRILPTALGLHLPHSLKNEISRRSAVENLITSAIGVATSSLILSPSTITNAVDSVSEVTLNSNNKKAFPLASFGLQVYNDDTAYKLTLTALECGYRNFFASVLAGNQRGFAKAVKDSNIPRKDLYIW